MPDLLLELFSEEIPARMQGQAAKDLERLVVGALSDRGLLFDGAKAFAGPRRLTLAVAGLPAKQPDVSEEKKGPRVGAPEKAVEGFLRSAGLKLEQCEKRDDGKGEFYVAVIARAGRATAEVLAEILPETIAKLPWPKSMRWPESTWREPMLTEKGGDVIFVEEGKPLEVEQSARWIRPLRSIVCTFNGEIVPFTFTSLKSGNTTFGHRFLSQGGIEVRRFDDYVKALWDAHVVLDGAEREAIILHEAKQKAFALGLELVEDEGLLEEVAGLAEWPVVLIGTIEDRFMDLPPEILQTSMRTHQKYFSLRDAKTGRLANRFAVVSNMVTGGKEIVAGNERVLRARLSDAKFFWDQDRRTKLADRVAALKDVVFHAKAGTMQDRVDRITFVAMVLTKLLGTDFENTKRAALLAKADLTTGVVGEFPELQGVMGRYYALHDHEPRQVADAIRDHYRPLGPNDKVPTSPVSMTLALADKIDNLVTLWRAGEKPTGSKDPFALRRAALGIIRIILENKLRVELLIPIFTAIGAAKPREERAWEKRLREVFTSNVLLAHLTDDLLTAARRRRDVETIASSGSLEGFSKADEKAISEVLEFLADRLKVALREKGTRHDLIDAVFSLGHEDDLVRLVARVEALQRFLASDDGANLLVAYRRAANILKAEEKRDKTVYDGAPDPGAFTLPEEKALYVELATAGELVRAEIARERFVEAMGVMSRLRKPVDAFFDKVTVNDKDPSRRQNRLLLLSRLRTALHLAADFSKIEG
ncbi:MAG: glycine--tRNA ligase subunit beta [Alphaproteobacteria bacterium]|nr:glycine--tRNA ligase subunit beta [Alphaproteobacteria bacterium]MDE2629793.1 glycine--tRNA ligase subunit beta [Alphaproteobacteria bacterium]